MFAYYPYCQAALKLDSEVHVLVLVGAIGNTAPLSKFYTILNDLPKRNRLTVRIYDDAHHGVYNFNYRLKCNTNLGILAITRLLRNLHGRK